MPTWGFTEALCTRHTKGIHNSQQLIMISLACLCAWRHQKLETLWPGSMQSHSGKGDTLGYLCDQPHTGYRPQGWWGYLTSTAHFPAWGASLSDGNRGMKDNIGIHLDHEKKCALLNQQSESPPSSTHTSTIGYPKTLCFWLRSSLWKQ